MRSRISLLALRSIVVAGIAATRVIVIAVVDGDSSTAAAVTVVIDSDVALSESCAII